MAMVGNKISDSVNREGFERRIRIAKETELLWWAGQFSKALDREKYLVQREQMLRLSDFELETRKTETALYRGVSWPLFPELGRQNLRLFTGVEEELLARTLEASQAVNEAAKSIQDRVAKRGHNLELPYESLSRNGTCMMIDGLA